eukprot:2163032-Rhodomonas_salina.2
MEPGYLGTWVPGYLGTWVPGYLGIDYGRSPSFWSDPGIRIATVILSIRAVPDLIWTNRLDSRILDSLLDQQHPDETCNCLDSGIQSGMVQYGGLGWPA